MRLGDGNHHITISALREAYVTGDGEDIFTGVEVRIGDFAASVGVVIAHSDWQAFMASLSDLEKNRRGEAILRSADFEELYLRVYAIDAAGHMAVAGHVERRDLPSNPRLTFDQLPFDPSLLPELVTELGKTWQQRSG